MTASVALGLGLAFIAAGCAARAPSLAGPGSQANLPAVSEGSAEGGGSVAGPGSAAAVVDPVEAVDVPEPEAVAPPLEVAPPPFPWAAAACPEPASETVSVLLLPPRSKGDGPRVLVAADEALEGPVEVQLALGRDATATIAGEALSGLDMSTFGYRFTGPPDAKVTGLRLRAGDRLLACRDARTVRARPMNGTVALERLYSLWITRLLDIPFGELIDSLTPLLQSPERNLLHDSLGLREDQPGSPVALAPDCADFPLVLRGYFAWKVGLPFGLNRVKPPPWWRAAVTPPSPPAAVASASPSAAGQQRVPGAHLWLVLDPMHGTLPAQAFQHHMVAVMSNHAWWRMQQDWHLQDSMLYPVAMTREGLRPGAVYVDPFSHVSMVAGWKDMGGGKARLILADAQPTKYIALHKYIEGRLVYRADRAAGFRWFRPLARARDREAWVPMGAGWLTEARAGARKDAGREPRLSESAFRERVETLQDPAPRDPREALEGLVDALEATLRERAKIVEAGFQVRREGPEIPLPPTPRLMFHGYGLWEAWSTPCRDLRLLAFLRIIDQFPEAVASNPARYRLETGETPEEARRRLEATREGLLRARTFTYQRSDGSAQVLSLLEVMARRVALEIGYHPNDCPEHRWGAPEGSEEAATCTLRATPEERARMEPWRLEFQAGYGCE